MRQLLQWHHLIWCMDQPSGEEIDSFDTVLSIPNVAAFDIDHPNHGTEHWSSDICIGRNANCHNCPSRTNIFSSLLEWLFVGSK